jgi:acetyltransferase
MLVRFTQIDYHYEMALIAVTTVDGKDQQIGVARYTTNLDKTSCEFALTVSDDWQHRGIGHILMRDLMDVARDRDLSEMEGQVLSNNRKMLELVRTLGFKVSNDPDDPSIKQVVARL